MPERVKPRLDITRVEILPFTRASVLNRFECGKAPIDRFLKNKAKKVSDRHEQRVFCAHIDGSSNVVGYYVLQLGTDSVAEVVGRDSSYLKNYAAFPSVHLHFLGVCKEYQRQGLGQHPNFKLRHYPSSNNLDNRQFMC